MGAGRRAEGGGRGGGGNEVEGMGRRKFACYPDDTFSLTVNSRQLMRIGGCFLKRKERSHRTEEAVSFCHLLIIS